MKISQIAACVAALAVAQGAFAIGAKESPGAYSLDFDPTA